MTILSTLPPAGSRALLMLAAFHFDLSIIATIGIILLIGIVKRNGIMMVDFAIQAEREQHLSPVESIRRACLLRFRPIMMTAIAALLGALPLMLESGTGSELRKPRCFTMVGGLILRQMLTLFTTPIVYLYLDRLNAKLGRARWGCRCRPASRDCPGVRIVMATRGATRASLLRVRAAVGDPRIRGPLTASAVRRQTSLVQEVLDFVGVEQATRSQHRHDCRQAGIGNCEATLASAKHAGAADHVLAHVPRRVHHNCPRERVAVGRVESLETHRSPVTSRVEGTRSVGPRRGRVRMWFVGETLKPAGARRIGAPTMCDQMRPHVAVVQPHQVESRRTGRKGEIGDSDDIAQGDVLPMSVHSLESTPQQIGGDRAVQRFGTSERGACAGSGSSHASEGKSDKRTTGKSQGG